MQSPELIIRKMSDEDAVYLAEIEEKTFSMPWKVSDFLEMNAHDNVTYLVAELDGVIIGGCGIMNIVGEGEITNVVISKEHRGKGYSYQMMNALLDEGRNMGITDFTLEVRVSNAPAIGLYEKLGFKGEGVRPGFYEKPREDALIMWLRDINR